MTPMVAFILDGLLVVIVETGREVFISVCFTVADRLQFNFMTSKEILKNTFLNQQLDHDLCV